MRKRDAAVALVASRMLSGKALLNALSMEFGVTLHSIFVGLALGVSGDSDVDALLVALCFHQFFEGVALSSRVVDARFSSRTEIFFSFVFSLAAPLGAIGGVAIAMGRGAGVDLSASYLLTQGVLDSICAGILLFV